MPSLPQQVQQQGISVDKSSSNILLVAAFISEDAALSQYDIADYVASNIKDSLSRTEGWAASSSLAPSTQCVYGLIP